MRTRFLRMIRRDGAAIPNALRTRSGAPVRKDPEVGTPVRRGRPALHAIRFPSVRREAWSAEESTMNAASGATTPGAQRRHVRPGILLFAFAFAVMADPVSSVAYAPPSAARSRCQLR
jgi:hypothetical protein